MTIPLVKYQVVISHREEGQMVMSIHSTLEEAQVSYIAAKMAMKAAVSTNIMQDPDWDELELQRVEVLIG